MSDTHPAGGGLRRSEQLVEVLGLDSPHYDRGDIARMVGLPGEETRRWWRAMGIVEVPDGVVAFGDHDLSMARSLATLLASEEGDEEQVLRLARLLGGSFSRLAEAQVAVIEEMLVRSRGAEALLTPDQRAEAITSEQAAGMVALMEQAMLYVWRRHLFATLGRWIGADDDQTTQAVGFADISGFSAMSKKLAVDELTAVIESFETAVVDVVAAHDGRVVKFIGDEALFVVDDIEAGVDIALELLDRMAATEHPVHLHCGIAQGPTVTIGGDVFGNTVNLAKRLTTVARKGRIVVTRDDAKALQDRADLQVSRVRRVFELKGVGRTQLASITRAKSPTSVVAPEPGGDRAAGSDGDSAAGSDGDRAPESDGDRGDGPAGGDGAGPARATGRRRNGGD